MKKIKRIAKKMKINLFLTLNMSIFIWFTVVLKVTCEYSSRSITLYLLQTWYKTGKPKRQIKTKWYVCGV